MDNPRYDYIDHLHRLSEFRRWLDTNILFPTIPDSIVKPMRDEIIKAEKILVGILYTRDEWESITAMRKATDGRK